MISDPTLIRYACIAHSTTVLAEFNTSDSTLQAIAQQCLLQSPPHHSIFSHTIRNRTYTFLIDDPFIYFGIFDEALAKSEQLLLLNRLRESLAKIIGIKSKWVNGSFSSYCIQGEFHPIFHGLMLKSPDFDSFSGGEPNGLITNGNHRNGEGREGEGGRKKVLSMTLFGGLKKKKRFGESVGESKEMLVEDKVDLSDDGEVTSRELCPKGGGFGLSDSGFGGGGRQQQKAKKIWRRQVWIVLTMDLAVCLILFGIWLCVCRGFQCIVDG